MHLKLACLVYAIGSLHCAASYRGEGEGLGTDATVWCKSCCELRAALGRFPRPMDGPEEAKRQHRVFNGGGGNQLIAHASLFLSPSPLLHLLIPSHPRLPRLVSTYNLVLTRVDSRAGAQSAAPRCALLRRPLSHRVASAV